VRRNPGADPQWTAVPWPPFRSGDSRFPGSGGMLGAFSLSKEAFMHHAARRVIDSLLLAGVAAPAFANKVWVVDSSGGGDYFRIQPAVNAAVDKDTILVKSGTYPGFTVDDKALSIVGDAGASVQLSGRVTVKNLASGKVVVLGGFTAIVSGGPVLRIQDDAGSVRVQAAVLDAASVNSSYPAWSTVDVVNSADVFLTECTLTGVDGSHEPGGTGTPGGTGLSLVNSDAAVYDCTIRGGDGGDSVGGPNWSQRFGGIGGTGCSVASGSFLFASDTTFRGGDGGDSATTGFCGGWGEGGEGGIGLSISAPQAELIGSSTQGGAGGHGYGDPGCFPCGCFDGAPGLAVDHAAFVDLIPGSPRILQGPLVARENTVAALDFQGEAADFVYLYLARQTVFQFSLPRKGVYIVPPASPAQAMGTADGTGNLPAGLSIPALGGGAQSRVYFLQSLHRTGASSRSLGTGRSLVVIDSMF
jgi:hypothetical protein